MRKKLIIAVFASCVLMLGACGKSEEEKAVDEIYNHLDAEGQAAVDQMRAEVASYEESRANSGEKDISNYKDDMVEWVIGEDILQDSQQNMELVIPSGVKILFPNKDVCEDYGGWWLYGSMTTGCTVSLSVIDSSNKKIYEGAEDIGNYYVYVNEGNDDTTLAVMSIRNKLTGMEIMLQMNGMQTDVGRDIFETNREYLIEQLKALPIVEAEIPYGVYQSESGVKIEISDTIHGEPMVWFTSLDGMQFYLKLSYTIDGTLIVTGTTDGILSYDGNAITIKGAGEIDGTYMSEVAAPVQGQIPYGYYVCESGAEAHIEKFHNEIDVIDIFLGGSELMTNFEYIGNDTYSLRMPNEVSSTAIAVFDENWNMQITAEVEEAKPFEGFYTLQ